MIIDVTRLIGRILKGYQSTGIDRVCIEYLNHFQGKTKTSIYLFNRLWFLKENFSFLLIDKLVYLDRSGLKKLIPLIPFNLTKPDKHELFFNLSHSGGLEQPRYVEVLRKYNLRNIFMIHDLIPIEHPELVKTKENQKHKQRIKNVLQLYDLIIVNSEQTKQKLINYATTDLKMPVNTEKIVVNYFGLSSRLMKVPEVDFSFVKNKYGLKNQYFVVISTIEPRKNHLILFYAWKTLHTLLKETTPQLVLTGRRGWENEQVIDFIERSSISSFLKEINSCDDSELKVILENSQALLMPSIDEGFGLPVLEAIMLDVPVVCSNIPTFVELFKDIPLYCDWHNATDWIDTVIQILTKGKDFFLERQIQRKKRNMKYISKYCWQYHFSKLKEILRIEKIQDLQEVHGDFVFSEQN